MCGEHDELLHVRADWVALMVAPGAVAFYVGWSLFFIALVVPAPGSNW